MGSKTRLAIYTIPAHRGFADALAVRLLDERRHPERGLADMLLLVPNNRAARAITEAFVRRAEPGLLLPRMAAVGDLDLGESLGAALDPMGADADIPPAIDPLHRQLLLASLVRRHFRRGGSGSGRDGESVGEAEALRLAGDLARVIDQMQVEQLPLKSLVDFDAGDLAAHWQVSRDLFVALAGEWPRMLAERGLIDPAERRNRLLDHVARRWAEDRPERTIVAAGISTGAPAIARLLRTIAELPNGMVVMPHLDLTMDAGQWDMLGPHGPDSDTGFRRRDMETHPQYHLKLLLDRMGIARGEVLRWTRSGDSDAPARRSHMIATAFAPPDFTAHWADLDYEARSLANVTLMEARDGNEEAQAIAIAVREALEQAGQRIAVVTANRALARRIAAHLGRWGIVADDSAGQPLAETPPGAFLLLLAEAAAARFAPIELLQLLKHPLAAPDFGDGENKRLAWLEQVRALDLVLRGPRPGAGLAGIESAIRRAAAERKGKPDLQPWWERVAKLLGPLENIEKQGFTTQYSAFVEVTGGLSADAVWGREAGRELARLMENIGGRAGEGPPTIPLAEWPAWLAEAMAGCAVRPAYGGHPRVAIYGLLEARLQQADFVICAGLNEGSWPQRPAPDPWLAPAIRGRLGLPALERNIGLAAHDLASALGSPRILLTRAHRDEGAPALASRFLLRLTALAGAEGLKRDERLLDLARALDDPGEFAPAARPMPDPSPQRRKVDLAVTDMDGIKADPFAFYAKKILRLRDLDPVDAEPTAAWRGTMAHDILEQWAKQDGLDPDLLNRRARAMLTDLSAHPLTRILWEPRLMEAIEWIGAEMARCLAEGRHPVSVERWGEIDLAGVTLKGRADRIDRMADGTLAIVDYKTGQPPSARKVKAGFALQLGLIGLIAERAGFEGDDGVRVQGRASAFEYWSLARAPSGERKGELGYVGSPAKGRDALDPDEIVPHCAREAEEAIAKWILGRAPFVAKLHPEHAPYGDYDQLMRLAEWYGREGRGE